MRRIFGTGLLIVTMAIAASAAVKLQGMTTLKDFQPTGTTDKSHKHQQYDLFFVGQGKQYTCRTSGDKSLKATDFVVGGDLRYQLDGNKGKLRNAGGQQVQCTVVRVEDLSTRAPR
jgi:hypothetical protein